MKLSRTKTLLGALAITLVGGVALSQTAGKFGHHMGGGEFPFGEHMLNFFADYLDLTAAQQAQVKDILAKEKPTIQPLLAQLAQSHQQLRQLAESGTFDEAKVRSAAAQQTQTMTELIVEKTRVESQLFQILTPDQKTKMDNFLNRHEQRLMHHIQQESSSE